MANHENKHLFTLKGFEEIFQIFFEIRQTSAVIRNIFCKYVWQCRKLFAPIIFVAQNHDYLTHSRWFTTANRKSNIEYTSGRKILQVLRYQHRINNICTNAPIYEIYAPMSFHVKFKPSCIQVVQGIYLNFS